MNTRVCNNCVERRRCRGTCGALLDKDHFTAEEWRRAHQPMSTDGYCKKCMKRNKHEKPCAGCSKWFPKDDHFTNRMWENTDEERRCKRCMYKNRDEKPCSSCGEWFRKEDHYTDWMWMLGDAERRCKRCICIRKETRNLALAAANGLGRRVIIQSGCGC